MDLALLFSKRQTTVNGQSWPSSSTFAFRSVSEQSTKTFFFSYMFGHWSLDQLPRLPKESKPKATKQA